jgi:hypothetical protein
MTAEILIILLRSVRMLRKEPTDTDLPEGHLSLRKQQERPRRLAPKNEGRDPDHRETPISLRVIHCSENSKSVPAGWHPKMTVEILTILLHSFRMLRKEPTDTDLPEGHLSLRKQ